MSNHDSKLKCLLSPSRSGTFFAPFRSRSANPDGFDSKMKLWIGAIEEWAILNKKLTLSLKDIHQTFISNTGSHPDKECIRLVLSEMKRKSYLVPLGTLRTSTFWSSSNSSSLLENFVDPKGWLGWSVKKFVYEPANWAISTVSSSQEQTYSDLTDMSIQDSMKFVCHKSLKNLSQNLLAELIRICKAEKQVCFEWQHLLTLITPIISTIIDATDGKELFEILDVLIEYLALNKHIAIRVDDDSRLVKVANIEDPNEDEVKITQKDVATARLLKARELLTSDVDRYHNQAQRARQDAMVSYSKKEIAKAKSLLRSHKRLMTYAEQKEAQLTNVEIMLEQLEHTDSNMLILKAYKEGAEALRIANTNIESNTSILDEMYDITAETRHLTEEMNQMLNDISLVSQVNHNTSEADLEAELNEFIGLNDQDGNTTGLSSQTQVNAQQNPSDANIDQKFVDELEQRLNNLIIPQDEPAGHSNDKLETRAKVAVLTDAT